MSKTTNLVKPRTSVSVKAKSKTRREVKPKHVLSSNGHASIEVIDEIRRLNRNLVTVEKSRIMVGNRLLSTVATYLGYYSTMEEADRDKKMDEARKYLKEIEEGDPLWDLYHSVEISKEGFNGFETSIVKDMERLAKSLPIAKWVAHADQSGFGFKSLARIIGEAGDLADYSNPGKLWARMGCHPFESKGKMQMGSTWRSGRNGKLSAEEWEDYGYCPRRRAIMYVISESLLKANKGPYRKRYDFAKKKALDSGDFHSECDCKGTGKTKKGSKCSRCSGKGYLALHSHKHAMLLVSKLLLKNLWIEWNPDLVEDIQY